DMPHRPRRHCEEVSAILPVRFFLIYQSQECFVDERRGLQRVPGALAIHMAFSHPPQFLINQRHQLIEGFLIPVAPVAEQLAHLLWCRCHHCGFIPAMSPSEAAWIITRKKIRGRCSSCSSFPFT